MGQAMSAGKSKLHQLESQHDSLQSPAEIESHQEAILAQVPKGGSAGGAEASDGRKNSSQVEAGVSGQDALAAKMREELQNSAQLPILLPAELGQFKADLQQVVDAGGGAVGNGWSVLVSLRPSGARDLLITAPSRASFRSMKSAVESLQPQVPVSQPESPRSPKQATGPRKRRKRVPYSPPDSAEGKRLLSRPPRQDGKHRLLLPSETGVADAAQNGESVPTAVNPSQQQQGGSMRTLGSVAVASSDAHAEARRQWKQRLQKVVTSGGGALENGWTVQVSPRSSGGRDITIQGPQGQRFRSIVQAVEALAPIEGGVVPPPAGQPGQHEMPQVGVERNAEAADRWKAKLQVVVDADGGVLENGWTVKVQRRATGGRDLCILGRQGERFRSISQAADALAGNPVTVRPKQKKRPRSPFRVPSLQSPSSQPGKRRKRVAPHSVSLTAVADGSQPAGSMPNGRPEKEPAMQTYYSKILARARIQVARLRREEDIINVYEAEGWRGANREKVKPSAELERARTQILKCQTALREDVRLCEEAGGDQAIPAELYDSDGELDEAHIFCAKCLAKESYDDNDIVLCDGSCGRAYHEKCTTPPFSAAEMNDYDWLCPACETKEEILELLNEEFDFKYDLETPWIALFKERPGSSEADGSGDNNTWAGFLGSAALAESDSEDEDFRSSGSEHSGNDEGDGEETESSSVESGDVAGSDKDAAGDGSDNSSSERESSQEEEEENEVVEGKRRRVAVDYAQLNSELFGDASTDDGEASDDDWS